jgi:GDPmannose 4,6-dehydratase
MHSVRTFVEKTFQHVGITIAWKGAGVDEVGYDAATGRELVFVDPKYFRPAEVDLLIADPSKAKTVLGWQPRVSLDELVKEMIEHEFKELNQPPYAQHVKVAQPEIGI